MRICYVLNQFPELSQTFVLRQILDLIERGHEVNVIAARPGTDIGVHAELGGAMARETLGQVTRYTGMPGGLLERTLRGLGQAAVRVLEYPRVVATGLDIRRFGWFAATGSLLSMGLPLANERRTYDAIIAHFGPQGVLAQGLREMGILSGPLLTFFHAYDLTSAPRLAGGSMYRRLFERGDMHVAICRRGAELLSGLGAPPERVRVHHLGVDVRAFRPRSKRGGGALRVVSIGRLVAKKGFEDGLRAVARARARGVPLEYSIYGSGPLAAALEETIERLGLRGIATLRGAASQSDLSEALGRSDVLLAPSVTTRSGDEEGIPVVLMEAMASGLPVVATDCGGVCELVDHDRCGLVVRQGDTEAMCDALARLHAHPAEGQRLGQAARARIECDYDELKQGERLVELLTTLQRVAA